MTDQDFENYISVFSSRYGSQEMRNLWSEGYKRRLWRRIWVALATAQAEAGLVSNEQAADLQAHAEQLNIPRARQIEAEIHHDLMAEVKTFAEQCTIGGGIIHLGATSADIQDNADVLRQRQALDIILERLDKLLLTLTEQILRWAELPSMGFTHIQPAEPTTLGYRLAQYAQDLLLDWREIRHIYANLRSKGLKGATGTSASYRQLLQDKEMTPSELEARVMAELDLEPFPVSTQTYPRKQDWLVLNGLAGLAGSLYKLAFDLRLLQSPLFGELSEPFGTRQVGSSAMPFKRNPVNAENMNSLGRFVAALPRVAWDNAAHSLLERTLDDSANRRLILPQAFLATDELLRRATRIVDDLVVREEAIQRNLETFGIFAATERLLMDTVQAGADRQTTHEVIREHAMAAWSALQIGAPNPLADRLATDKYLTRFVTPNKIRSLLEAREYVGDAPQRAQALAHSIRDQLVAP
jgi:adenylosuccinate lyase